MANVNNKLILGRVDDVINPSGHRIGTAEIESALVACPEVSDVLLYLHISVFLHISVLVIDD